MSCIEAPCGVTVEAASFNSYVIPSQNGNDVYNIPVKEGAPLSAANERAGNILGSIPSVVRFPSFTLIGGAVKASKASNGGFASEAGLTNMLNKRIGEGAYDNLGYFGSTCA